MERCNICNIAGVRDSTAGLICCPRCGKVLDFEFSEEATFVTSSDGQSRLSGTVTMSIENNASHSYQQTLLKGQDEICTMVIKLGIGGGHSIVKQAASYHKIALDRSFTRGRLTSLVTASCLYIACREQQKPYLLIDFSEALQVSVYELGHVFLQLCQLLRLGEHSNFLVDPALFMPRFSECLLKERNVKVEKTALRILASMKRDWMQTGRKPSGLCGAALYISALSFGIQCSKSEIASVVHMCEDTLTKRLIEFENTESGSMTIEELNRKSNGYVTENMNATAVTGEALLCKHKDSGEPHSAHGLCQQCYRNFVELSGGHQGGSDPPAFQRAERQRTANSAENIPQESSPFFQDLDDEPGNLSDIDDAEVGMYIHNAHEADMKRIIWEKMNWEYIEQEAAKQKAAKETYEAMLKNGSKEILNPEELAAAVSAAVAKSRKDKRQQKSAALKNAGPARTPAEAVAQMLKGKRLSSKINYDALENLFDEHTNTDDLKRKCSPPSSDDAADTQQYKKGRIGYESYDKDNEIEADEYFSGAEEDADVHYWNDEQVQYGDHMYHGNQEEYDYEDYDPEC